MEERDQLEMGRRESYGVDEDALFLVMDGSYTSVHNFPNSKLNT